MSYIIQDVKVDSINKVAGAFLLMSEVCRAIIQTFAVPVFDSSELCGY